MPHWSFDLADLIVDESGEVEPPPPWFAGAMERALAPIRADIRDIEDSIRDIKDSIRDIKDSIRGIKDNIQGIKDNIQDRRTTLRI